MVNRTWWQCNNYSVILTAVYHVVCQPAAKWSFSLNDYVCLNTVQSEHFALLLCFWGLFFQTGTLTFFTLTFLYTLHLRSIYRASCKDCKEWLIDTSNAKQATRPTFVWTAFILWSIISVIPTVCFRSFTAKPHR